MHEIYKCTIKIYTNTKSDTHIASFHTGSNPLGPGLPSPATFLFNHVIRGIMPILRKLPISQNNDYEHYEALLKKQKGKNHDTSRNHFFFQIVHTLTAQ